METLKTNNIDVEKNQGASSEDGEHPFPNKKRKVIDQDDEANKHHEGFQKPQAKRKKSNSQGHQGKFKKPNANTNKKSKQKKTPIANRVLIAQII